MPEPIQRPETRSRENEELFCQKVLSATFSVGFLSERSMNFQKLKVLKPVFKYIYTADLMLINYQFSI